jgi:hypothetical protein
MPGPPISRRAFLAGSGALALSRIGHHIELPIAGKKLVAGILTEDPYASSTPQRFGFALLDRHGGFASGPRARIAFGPRGQRKAAYKDTKLHPRGLPKRRGIYTVDAAFPQSGIWTATVKVAGQRVPLAFEVQDHPQAPAPGMAAPRVASPTVADPLGVDPICTRNPPCLLHQQSLATAIGAGKPVAVMFATPARCESRYCGPVLDELLKFVDSYRERIAFVHVEIYTSLTSSTLIPAVEAWGLPGEPWLFGVNAGGTVVARLDGAFGADEQKQLLDGLVGGTH